MNIIELNKRYRNLTPHKRIAELYKDFDADKIVFTSSFGTTAALLLKMIQAVNPNQKIFF